MSNKIIQVAKQRWLSPRIYIYSILLLLLAWLMHRHVQPQIEAGQPLREAESIFVEPARDDLPVKDSELRSVAAKRLPLLVLVGKHSEDLTSLREALLVDWRESYSIVLLQADADTSVLRYFQVKTSPAAILFTPDNEERARYDEPLFNAESLNTWLKSLQ